jgi:hypothetical protein
MSKEVHERRILIDHLIKKIKKAARRAEKQGTLNMRVQDYLEMKREHLEGKDTTELRNLAMKGPVKK